MDLRSLWRRFGGSSADGPTASSDAGGPAAAGDAGGEPPVDVARPTRPAWRDLAPIPPTVRPHPLVAPTVAFSHELSGHQPAPLALETLGHDRPADAPAGVVSGLFVGHSPHTPVQDASGGTERASVRGQAPRPGERPDAGIAPGPPRLAGSAGPAPAGPAPRSASGSAGPSASVTPAHRPVVARSVAGSSGPTALTHAPSPATAAPAGSIGRPAVEGTTPTAPRPVPSESTGSADAARIPSIAIIATPVDLGPAEVGAVARRNLGQTRRLRIGPAIGPGALESGDAGPLVGHGSERPGAPGPAPTRPDGTRDLSVAAGPPATSAGAEHDAPAAGISRSTGPAAPATPDRPDSVPNPIPDVLRSVATPGAAGRPVPARPIAPPRPVERAPLVGRLEVGRGSRGVSGSGGTAARAAAPASSSESAAPRSTVQEALAALSGAASNVAPTGARAAGSGGAGAGTTAPAIQRTSADAVRDTSSSRAGSSDPWGAAQSGVSVATAGGSPVVARSAAAWSGPSAVSGSGGPSGSWSAPIRQLGAATAARTDGPRPSASHGVVGSVQSRAVASFRAGAVAPTPASGTVWRSADPSEDAGAGPDAGRDTDTPDTIERLDAGASIAPPAVPVTSVAVPTVLRAADGGDGGSGGAAGAGGSDKELDELARKLFPRLQLKLRGELLVDRERIGALVDLGR